MELFTEYKINLIYNRLLLFTHNVRFLNKEDLSLICRLLSDQKYSDRADLSN